MSWIPIHVSKGATQLCLSNGAEIYADYKSCLDTSNASRHLSIDNSIEVSALVPILAVLCFVLHLQALQNEFLPFQWKWFISCIIYTNSQGEPLNPRIQILMPANPFSGFQVRIFLQQWFVLEHLWYSRADFYLLQVSRKLKLAGVM